MSTFTKTLRILVLAGAALAAAASFASSPLKFAAGKCADGNCDNGECILAWDKLSDGITRWYQGDCKNHRPNGKGTGNHRGPDNAIYIGDYERGLEHGKGFKDYGPDTAYYGDWVDGKRQGKGTKWWPSGDAFEGQYKNNKADGPGIMYYKDGTAAEGNFNPSTGFTITKPLGRRPFPTRPARPKDPLNQ